jgi:DNA-binding transcriptional LysR family regulator
MHFSSYDQLIQAAVAGQGIALGRLPLIDRLVKARKLVPPFPDAVVSPRGYCVIVAAQAAAKPEVAAFVAWLMAAARGPDSARPRGRAQA